METYDNIGAFATLIWIIPCIYALYLILLAFGFNIGSFSGDSLTSVLINLIWVVFLIRISEKIF